MTRRELPTRTSFSMSFLLNSLRRPLFNARLGAPSGALSMPLPLPGAAQQVRHRGQLAPRKMKWIKRHRGVIPIPTGGSTKGTTLAFGEYGIRIRSEGLRLTAKQLTTADEVLKRKLKPLKGAKIWMRVFPDIPVCVKVRAVAEYLRYGSGSDATLCAG